jgi:AraC-like DNA-binding protein
MRRRSHEWARYWASPDDGVELLRARYVEHRYDPHIHETYAFGLVEGGRQTFACRGERHYSTGGSIFAINPGDAHDGEAADDDGFVYRMIYVEPKAMAAHLADAGAAGGAPLFRTAMFFDGAVARLLAQAHDTFAEEAPRLEREHRLQAFAVGIARHGRLAPNDRRAPARNALVRAKDYLHAHFREDVSLVELAEVAQLGRHHLTRSFTRAFGIAPHRYLTQIRLAAARRKLAEGRAIAAVALDVGFADQSHLNRRFKRAFGITPRQFQRAVTNVQ